MDKERNLALDYIRIIAIFMIINSHFCTCCGLFSSPVLISANGSTGYAGTVMFFALSGFLLRQRNKELPSIGKFYIRRFWVIYPTFYIAYIACGLFTIYINRACFFMENPYKLIYTVLGLDSFLGLYGVSTYTIVGEWFTGAIVIIYLIFPLINFLHNKSKIITSILIYGLFLINVIFKIDPAIVDASLFTGLAMFYTGMLLSECSEALKGKPIVGLAGIVIAVIVMCVKLPGPYIIWLFAFGIALFAAIYVIFGMITEKLGKSKMIVFLSTISYPVYILHHFILNYTAPKILSKVVSDYKYLIEYVVFWSVTLIGSIVLHYVTNFVVKFLKGINAKSRRK